MKEIKAIIQPFMLTKVIEALKLIENMPGITVDRHVRGFGGTEKDNPQHKIVDDLVEYVEKVKLEVVVPDEMVDLVVNTIQEKAHTGHPGDGKIFIYNVQEVVKIRTNERGEKAI